MFERYVIHIIYFNSIEHEGNKEAIIKINEWTGIRNNNIKFNILILNEDIKNFDIEYKTQFDRYVKKYGLRNALKYKKNFIYKFISEDVNQSLENFTEKTIKE